MNWILLIIALIAGFLLFESFRHHAKRGFMKYIIIGIIIILLLMVVSAYIDLSKIFEEDSSFVKTGNVIKNNIEKTTELAKETNSSILDNFKESTTKVFDTG